MELLKIKRRVSGQKKVTRAGLELELKLVRSAIIAARRSNDDQEAARLSEVKASIKKTMRKFCECGHWKRNQTSLCPSCRLSKYGLAMGFSLVMNQKGVARKN